MPKHRRVSGLTVTYALAAILLASAGTGAFAQANQPYRLGVSGMLTGTGSSFYAAQAEGLRIFFDRLNEKGGINGHPVTIVFRDNRGDPATAAADAQAFIDGDVVGASLFSASNTAPGFAQAITRSKLPVVNASWCYGPSVPGGGPKVAENYFCAGITSLANVKAFIELFDRFATMVKEKKAAYGTIDVPGALASFNKMFIPSIEKKGWANGGYLAAVPFNLADYSPAARAIIDSGAQAVNVYCVADCTLPFLRAIRAAGFKGPMTAVLASSEPEFRALKDPDLYLVVNDSLIEEGKPVHKAILEAAKRFNARATPGDLLDGWLIGMVYEKALGACGYPCAREKLTQILNSNFTLDSQDAIDLIGGKIEWTATVHHLRTKAFRIVHWSNEKQAFVDFGQAIAVEDTGLVFPKL
jgi:branched-chain amino acid transport system substrate-binding protein